MSAQNLPGLILDYRHPLARGLVGWWPMNEGGGTRVNDISGNGNHGAFGNITQGPTSGRTGGALGGAVRMDGSDDQITVPTSKSLAVLGDITLCAWINITSFAGVGQIFGKGASYPNPYSFVYYNDKRLAFTRGNGVSQGYIESVSTIVGGKPEFVVASWSGGVNKIYIDGALRDSNSASNPTVTDNGLSLYIGRRSDAVIPFAGSMWHLRIYNRCLDAREVAQLYADPLAGALVPSRLTRLYTVPVASPPAAATGPLSSDRLYNRSLSRIFRRGETG